MDVDQTRTNERLAVLESLMQGSKEDRAEIKLTLAVDRTDTREALDEIKASIERINHQLARYTGFWGGIVLLSGAVWTFFSLFWKTISLKLGLGGQ